MKNLKNIILEKLIINKNIQSQFNPDNITNDKIVMYSDRWDEDKDTLDMDWEDTKRQLEEIDKDLNCGGYMLLKFKSLGMVNDPKKLEILDIGDSLEPCIDTIITGKDYGYEVRLVGGHLEIDCINSGSCVTYYIYAIEKTAWDHLEAYWEGDDEVNSLAFLYRKESIIPIKDI